MRRDSSRRFIPRENKSSADKRKKAMYDRFNKYRPECLFVKARAAQFVESQQFIPIRSLRKKC